MSKDLKKQDGNEIKAPAEAKMVTKLSEEDEELKKNIEDMINGVLDPDYSIQLNAYQLLKKEITSSTETMTSIPRPLKFFRQHYEKLKSAYTLDSEAGNINRKTLIGDLLCILVLVTDTKETSLQYILENNLENFFEWGQELVRSLSGEITTEYLKRLDEDKPYEDLTKLAIKVVTTLLTTNNENEAIDLLIEMDLIDEIKFYCNPTNYKKICNYLIASSNFAADSIEQRKILEIVYEIYTKYLEYTNALLIAIKLNEHIYIKSTVLNCPSKATQIQMAFILARSRIPIDFTSLPEDIQSIVKNTKASEIFRQLSRTLDIVDPKHPEDIFKSHLEEKKEGIQLESYKTNMSLSIVSSLINAGFGTELLMSKKDNDWLAKNKEEGLVCALAGIGLVNLWDIESGPNEIEKFLDTNEMNPFKRGGYNLGLGILSSSVNDDNNTAFALLSDQVKDKK